MSGAKTQQMAGQLYRVNMATSERRWIADVGSDGSLSKSAKCSSDEHFEAEVKHPLAVPDDPSRVPCKRDLVFSFTRPEIATAPYAKDTFLAASKEKVDVVGLSELAALTARAKNPVTAQAASDAVVSSTAIWLGDAKLENLVLRDATNNFRLVFTVEGAEALKAKQAALKLEPTGRIDLATQRAVTAAIFDSPNIRTATTYCSVGIMLGTVNCSGRKPKPNSSTAMKEVQVRYGF
jgi:hypothetical protein